MKLPSRSDLVKPDRSALVTAAVTVLITVLTLQLIMVVTSREQQRIDRFGEATAGALAQLAVEPLMQQDRMHLGVLGNRLAELPEIAGVATFSSDDQLLATTGSLDGPQYTRPVVIDDSIVGYVRVAVDPLALAPDQPRRTGILVLALVLIPLLVASGWTLGRAVRSGTIGLPLAGRARRPRQPEDGFDRPALSVEHPADPEPAPPADIRHYLLAVNLYNQLTLPPDQREFELSLCLELAGTVAELYQGQVVSLPGVGALLDFDHTDQADRPFEVLCAAFVLARLLQDEAPFGTYRLGLHLTELPGDEPLPSDHAAVADAALLSALARDGSLAVSAPYARTLPGPQRVHARPLANPLLDELATSDAECRLVTGLAGPYAGLVARQAEQLRSQRDPISSPSTF